MADDRVTGYDFSGVDGGGFLWEETCQGGVLAGLDNRVKILNGAVVVGNDTGDHHIQPVVPLILLSNILKTKIKLHNNTRIHACPTCMYVCMYACMYVRTYVCMNLPERK